MSDDIQDPKTKMSLLSAISAFPTVINRYHPILRERISDSDWTRSQCVCCKHNHPFLNHPIQGESSSQKIQIYPDFAAISTFYI